MRKLDASVKELTFDASVRCAGRADEVGSVSIVGREEAMCSFPLRDRPMAI